MTDTCDEAARCGSPPLGILAQLSQSMAPQAEEALRRGTVSEWTREDPIVDLLVVRHAIAEDREAFAHSGKDDSERPLTPEGRSKFERAARGLRKVVASIDLLATSKLVRAIETGEILETSFGIEASARLDELAPDTKPPSLVQWLRRRRRHRVVAVVGHEPHLSHLIAYLLVGRSSGFVELKKGGAVLLALGTAPEAGRAKLRWHLTPAQLRRLGR